MSVLRTVFKWLAGQVANWAFGKLAAVVFTGAALTAAGTFITGAAGAPVVAQLCAILALMLTALGFFIGSHHQRRPRLSLDLIQQCDALLGEAYLTTHYILPDFFNPSIHQRFEGDPVVALSAALQLERFFEVNRSTFEATGLSALLSGCLKALKTCLDCLDRARYHISFRDPYETVDQCYERAHEAWVRFLDTREEINKLLAAAHVAQEKRGAQAPAAR